MFFCSLLSQPQKYAIGNIFSLQNCLNKNQAFLLAGWINSTFTKKGKNKLQI